MNAPRAAILDELAWLVACDTRNPPRLITSDAPLFAKLRERLQGFAISLHDFNDGCLAFHAVRGAPSTLFNVHLDTVPDAQGWAHDPHTLVRAHDRAIGLGACDIKGAAACLLALADASDAPMAVVFTTDEEAGSSVAVRSFLDTKPTYDRVVIAEPTAARAVTAHRGIVSAEARFTGTSGHASKVGRSAVHAAAQWITDALAASWARDVRLNFGRIEGGLKSNMIAADCVVNVGMRPPPGEDPGQMLSALSAAGGDALASLDVRFSGPNLPRPGDAAAAAQRSAAQWARTCGVDLADPVDFWTEAALFSAAGYPAIVLGPGAIAQAHTVDEWVAYADLDAAFAAYNKMLRHG